MSPQHRMKGAVMRRVLGATAAITLLLSVLVLPALAQDKVTLCHAAGLDGTTKYITLTVGWPAAYGPAGHFYEDGTPRAGHENDYLGACEGDEPSATPPITPSPSPTTTPSATPSLTPEPSATPQVTPQPSPEPTDSTPPSTPTPMPSVAPSPTVTPTPGESTPIPTLPPTDTE